MNSAQTNHTFEKIPTGSDLSKVLEKYSKDSSQHHHKEDSPQSVEELLQKSVIQPAKHILNRPGKSFRSAMVEMAWKVSGAKGSCPEQLMNVVELLHAGSLIVDDIQDNAEMRRGIPAVHRVYGMPLALNTGNWLYFVALSELTSLELEGEKLQHIFRQVTDTLIKCHKGQALDLSVDVTTLSQIQTPIVVKTTTHLKTGALMSMATFLGAVAVTGEPNSTTTSALCRFGKHLGVALQMLDDLSGILNPNRLHKGIEDLEGKRPTWVWSFLASTLDEITFARIQKQTKESTNDHTALKDLIHQMRTWLEQTGPEQIQAYLDHHFKELEQEFHHNIVVHQMQQECQRLLRSYL